MSINFFPLAIDVWNCHIISVEYPTYGVYKAKSISQKRIFEDAEDIYDHLVQTLGLKKEQIIVFGRSIGSGPACHLASSRPIGGLILFAAYLSLRDIAKEIVGSVFAYGLSNRFLNKEAITKVKAPTIFIHGKKDNVINYKHSVELHKLSPAE